MAIEEQYDLVKPRSSKSGYLPSLDGWRFLAILGVMFTHDVHHVIHGHKTDFYQGFGGYGVLLFFAISGVLISWRILQDERRQGTFSLKNFYIRRFFRIQPPQWVYLAVVAAFMLTGIFPTAQWRFWWGAFLMYENFLWHNFQFPAMLRSSYLVGHFWTLAVEEHFYLLISLFFFAVRKHRAPILGTLLGGLLLCQQIAAHHHLWSDDVSNRRTYWILQYLIFPSLMTLLLQYDSVMQIVLRWWRPWLAFGVTGLLMYAHEVAVFHVTAVNIRALLALSGSVPFYCFTGWVIATMLHPGSWTTRFLELAPLRYLGRLSYSLYLWHLLFFGGGAPERCTWHLLTVLNSVPLRYLCSLLLAMASYYLVEKPMIRLGHRLAPPATPGHKDLSGTAALL